VLTSVTINLGPWRSILIFILNVASSLQYIFPFPLLTAKLIGDCFDNSQYGANRILLFMMRQFISATNYRSIKRDTARTRKKSGNFIIRAVTERTHYGQSCLLVDYFMELNYTVYMKKKFRTSHPPRKLEIR
jgi:hypothetical protein